MVSELIFIARDMALEDELKDLRGLIDEEYYDAADICLMRSLQRPIMLFFMEAVDTLWTINAEYCELNGLDVDAIPNNELAEKLATDMVDTFICGGYADNGTTFDFRSKTGLFSFLLTANHVLYETAILLMQGETSMDDPDYCSEAWDIWDDLGNHLDRSDESVQCLATAIEMFYLWQNTHDSLHDT
ncbi:MAG: hypothetical protein EOO88_38055 [Pedobacter sp.]|nr:MAG: hypothetical protein EOO88_38055 [Pedobacter sp.]